MVLYRLTWDKWKISHPANRNTPERVWPSSPIMASSLPNSLRRKANLVSFQVVTVKPRFKKHSPAHPGPVPPSLIFMCNPARLRHKTHLPAQACFLLSLFLLLTAYPAAVTATPVRHRLAPFQTFSQRVPVSFPNQDYVITDETNNSNSHNSNITTTNNNNNIPFLTSLHTMDDYDNDYTNYDFTDYDCDDPDRYLLYDQAQNNDSYELRTPLDPYHNPVNPIDDSAIPFDHPTTEQLPALTQPLPTLCPPLTTTECEYIETLLLNDPVSPDERFLILYAMHHALIPSPSDALSDTYDYIRFRDDILDIAIYTDWYPQIHQDLIDSACSDPIAFTTLLHHHMTATSRPNFRAPYPHLLSRAIPCLFFDIPIESVPLSHQLQAPSPRPLPQWALSHLASLATYPHCDYIWLATLAHFLDLYPLTGCHVSLYRQQLTSSKRYEDEPIFENNSYHPYLYPEPELLNHTTSLIASRNTNAKPTYLCLAQPRPLTNPTTHHQNPNSPVHPDPNPTYPQHPTRPFSACLHARHPPNLLPSSQTYISPYLLHPTVHDHNINIAAANHTAHTDQAHEPLQAAITTPCHPRNIPPTPRIHTPPPTRRRNHISASLA
jgi:hypothetical protein